MKKINFIFVLIFLINANLMAQTKDSGSLKKVIESGTKGDIFLGKENKKKQLNAAPHILNQEDSSHKAPYIAPKKKKAKNKNSKTNK